MLKSSFNGGFQCCYESLQVQICQQLNTTTFVVGVGIGVDVSVVIQTTDDVKHGVKQVSRNTAALPCGGLQTNLEWAVPLGPSRKQRDPLGLVVS